MMESREIEAELLEFLSREVFAPGVALSSQTDLVAAGFDSMSLVRVLLFIETRHGFWIPERELTPEALRNVGSLAATVARLLHEP